MKHSYDSSPNTHFLKLKQLVIFFYSVWIGPFLSVYIFIVALKLLIRSCFSPHDAQTFVFTANHQKALQLPLHVFSVHPRR